MADIVDDFLARLRHHLPETPPDRLRALEVEVREHWGGSDRLYVAKRPALVKQHRLALALQQGLPNLQQAFARAGVSRRTGYRWIAARPK